MEKKKYLLRKVEPFNVYINNSPLEVLNSLKSCSFQGRNLGKALDILHRMVSDDNCLTVLSLSGAMVPAGMGEIICALMENHLIDVLVTTGANISHSLVNVMSDQGHYIGTPHVNDSELYKLKINRVYDTYVPEDNYDLAEIGVLKILKKIYEDKIIDESPSSLFKKIGNQIKQRCILSIAALNDIPIFVPAITDSEFCLDLIKYTIKENFNVNLRIIDDVKRFAGLIESYEECGTIIIGGGVPRNWTQQIFPYIDNLNQYRDKGIEKGYKYSVRIHTATEYDGGLSGCTISESISWGKYCPDSNFVSVWCDATIALPILVTALFEKLKIKKKAL